MLWAAGAGGAQSTPATDLLLPSWWGVRGGATPTATTAAEAGKQTEVEAEAEEEPPRDMRIPITLVSGFLGACVWKGGFCPGRSIRWVDGCVWSSSHPRTFGLLTHTTPVSYTHLRAHET